VFNPAVLKQCSTQEKIQIMHFIWEELSCSGEAIESPAWHEEALAKTIENRVQGNEPLLDWSDVKKELRDNSQ
jgi:hypothetical protein